MPNIHTPERGPDEPREKYKMRRLFSREVFKMSQRRKQPPFRPDTTRPGVMPNMGAWWLGLHRNVPRCQVRLDKKAAGGFRQYKKQRAERRRVEKDFFA